MSVFECGKCKKIFERKQEYKRHQNRIFDCITGEKIKKNIITFNCHECGKPFNRKDNLLRHEKLTLKC